MVPVDPEPEPEETDDDQEEEEEEEFVDLDDSSLPSTDDIVVNWDGEVVDTK